MKKQILFKFLIFSLVVFAWAGTKQECFSQKTGGNSTVEKKTSANDSQVFDRVEEVPRPKDGDDGWNAYLSKNVKYAQNDRETGVEGTVIVGFEIHADGSVQNVEVLRGVGGECDQEAVRVVAGGPNWEPGKIGGEAVNTRMSMPIQFKLSGSTSSNSLEGSRENAIAKLYEGGGIVVIGYLPKASK